MSFRVTEKQLRDILAKFGDARDFARETGERGRRVYFAPYTEVDIANPADQAAVLGHVDGIVDRDHAGNCSWLLWFYP